jgi:membrane protein
VVPGDPYWRAGTHTDWPTEGHSGQIDKNRIMTQVERVTVAARQFGTRWRKRFEATAIGKVWDRLSELGFVDSSVQFSAAFILFFIPFLLLVSALIGRDLPHALVTRSGFSPQAAHDVTTLFSHRTSSITVFTIVGAILTITGADSMAKILQNWYGKVFAQNVAGWKKPARRAHWLLGAAGYLMIQFFIGRRIEPVGGPVPGGIIQFLFSVAFWWWSVHTLLAGTVRWRRLFVAGLATAVCYGLVGLYVRIWASWTIVTNESSYGPIGAVMTILATLVALGIAIHLGAVIGADYGQGLNKASQPSA